MKIREILTETQSPEEVDNYYNSQATMVKKENEKYYEKYFTKFNQGITPVFKKATNYKDDTPNFTVTPADPRTVSAGGKAREKILRGEERIR